MKLLNETFKGKLDLKKNNNFKSFIFSKINRSSSLGGLNCIARKIIPLNQFP